MIKQAASKNTWAHPQARAGRRPMRVDTLIRKDNDGSLYEKNKKKLGEIVKQAIAAGAGVPAEYVTTAQDEQGSAANKSRWFPSKDDQGIGGAKRQDMRNFAANEPAMGTFLFEMGPQPIEKTSAMRDELVKIALAGRLGKALDVISHAEGPIEVGGLGILAAPSLDNMQARFRARRAGLVDEHGEPTHAGMESKRLISEKYHDPIEAGGLGILASPYLAKRIHTGRWH